MTPRKLLIHTWSEEDLKEVLKQIYRALKMDAKLAELDK
jgi:hypothetical protein